MPLSFSRSACVSVNECVCACVCEREWVREWESERVKKRVSLSFHIYFYSLWCRARRPRSPLAILSDLLSLSFSLSLLLSISLSSSPLFSLSCHVNSLTASLLSALSMLSELQTLIPKLWTVTETKKNFTQDLTSVRPLAKCRWAVCRLRVVCKLRAVSCHSLRDASDAARTPQQSKWIYETSQEMHKVSFKGSFFTHVSLFARVLSLARWLSVLLPPTAPWVCPTVSPSCCGPWCSRRV